MQQSFSALGVSVPLVKTLSSRNINVPFAIQELVLPDALAGIDILAESPTGSGKTLAFGLPLLQRTAGARSGVAALVLVPTRELAAQVMDDLEPLAAAVGLRVAAVYGGTPIQAQIRRANAAQVVVATPGRLHDLLVRRAIRLNGVRVLVLDEADRMLDMGFKPQVDKILREVPVNRQTMLFSATFGPVVTELARAYTTNPSRMRATAPVETHGPLVEHTFIPVTAEDKLERLVEHLRGERGLALVFVRTKHGADKLARKLLRQYDVSSAAMHGNMSQNARERTLAHFQSGRVSTLVATDLAARGLDVDDITHVINFDPPAGADDYVHRVGRTGRAGRTGSGVTLVLPEQQHDVGLLAARLGHSEAFDGSGMKTRAGRPSGSGSGSGSNSNSGSAPRRRRRRPTAPRHQY
jgi:ATP-dependent RNA helicase RhlE